MNVLPIVADMVRRAEQHATDSSKDRLRAVEYYEGVMKDTPSDGGRSAMVTRDVRAQVKKVLPSIMRTIFGSDEVVEFLPMAEGDEGTSQQATDYMNAVVLPESNAYEAVYDGVHDALVLRNGILKWWHEEKKCVKISKHTGLTDDDLAILVSEDNVEVVEQTARQESIEAEDGQVEITVYDVKIRRSDTEKKTKCAAVPRENLLIHPDAVSLADSKLTGEKTTITRSELVQMGYDRELVGKFTITGDDNEDERDARRDTLTDKEEAQRANDELDYYDLFIRVDMDNDGIAELRHMVFAGGLAETNLLENDEVDEIQMCDICVMRQPHQWEATSLADDLMDIQRGKSIFLRQTIDNLMWQNNPQPIVQWDAIENPDAVLNPEFGLPIRLKRGHDVREAVSFAPVPFVAQHSYGMMDYLDKEATERTGVSDASSGLAPDALQNMTAKASAMIEQAGIGQTEMMVRNIAEGLRTFFRGLYRLTVRHQDKPRTVRLRDEWVEIDPRHWSAEMDCTVNTGLGAGTRERDMQMMQVVMGVQEKLLGAFGPDNPFVKPENLYAAVSKMVESAGLKTPALYFTEPDPEQIKALMEGMRNKKPPEQMKIEAQMQLEQAKMTANRDKEMAQMEADLNVKQAEIQASSKAQAEKLQSDALMQQSSQAFEWRKFEAEMAWRREESAMSRQDAIWQAQANSMNQPNQEAS